MALKNRQNGVVQLMIGTQNVPGYAKNVIEFDEIALKTDITGTNSGVNTGDETLATLVATLGIPTAADDTAAAALDPEVAVGGLYFTGEVFQVRLA